MSGLVRAKGRWHTPNAVEGVKVYGERLVRLQGKEHREWSAGRSKLAAYLTVGGKRFRPRPKDHWLYLGAASGTTVSHVSDLLPEGRIVAVEFSARPFYDLVTLANRRTNILPVLSDAAKPEAYAPLMERPVDVVYQDIAQREQAKLFTRNLDRFLARDGLGFLAIKARSVDVAARPMDVFRRIKQDVEAAGYRAQESVVLDPWQKDHAVLVVAPV